MKIFNLGTGISNIFYYENDRLYHQERYREKERERGRKRVKGYG